MARSKRSNNKSSRRVRSTPASPRLDRFSRRSYRPINPYTSLKSSPPSARSRYAYSSPRYALLTQSKSLPAFSPSSASSRSLANLINRAFSPTIAPSRTLCGSRKARREVLFATRSSRGSGLGRVRPPKYSESSKIRC